MPSGAARRSPSAPRALHGRLVLRPLLVVAAALGLAQCRPPAPADAFARAEGARRAGRGSVALRHYRLAADGGHPLGAFTMAYALRDGYLGLDRHGRPVGIGGRDPARARGYARQALGPLRAAAARGDTLALQAYAALLLEGFGTPADPDAALAAYATYARRAGPDARVRLADLLRRYGRGPEGVGWARGAAREGSAAAFHWLATEFARGTLLPLAFDSAAVYLDSAAARGDVEAARDLEALARTRARLARTAAAPD